MAKRIKKHSDLPTFEWLRPLLLEEIRVDVPGISEEDLRRVAQNSFSRPASPMSCHKSPQSGPQTEAFDHTAVVQPRKDCGNEEFSVGFGPVDRKGHQS